MENSGGGREDQRKSVRNNISTEVEFYVNADIIEAETIDISETGIRIETREPAKIFLRIKIEGRTQDYEAKMVWARKNLDGRMTYGFEYIPDSGEDEPF